MDVLVQWVTILSPIIAVGLAWWTSRKGARDAAKQIASVKELTRVQIELTKIKLDKELWDARIHQLQASKREVENDSFYQIGGFSDSLRRMQNEKKDLSDKFEFYSNQMQRLEYCIGQIEKLNKKLGGE